VPVYNAHGLSKKRELEFFFFLSRKEFNIRLCDKHSESDYFVFPPPKSEYFFQQHWESEYFFRSAEWLYFLLKSINIERRKNRTAYR
jgi:hypothetical protein